MNTADLERRQRAAGRQAAAVAKAAATPGRTLVCDAFVTAVNAGPPPTVDVTLHGVATPAVRYLASYTPTVGDRIAVDVTAGGDVLVLGKIAS